MKENTNNIGASIRKYREAKGLTVRKLGELSGVSYSQITKYENGKAYPSFYTIERLAKALDVRIFDLMDSFFVYDLSNGKYESYHVSTVDTSKEKIIDDHHLRHIVDILESLGYYIGASNDDELYKRMIIYDINNNAIPVKVDDLKALEKESDDYFKFKLQSFINEQLEQ